jgi:hypothetical protein
MDISAKVRAAIAGEGSMLEATELIDVADISVRSAKSMTRWKLIASAVFKSGHVNHGFVSVVADDEVTLIERLGDAITAQLCLTSGAE